MLTIEHPATSRVTVTPAVASMAAQGVPLLDSPTGLYVHLREPSKTSKRTPRVPPLEDGVHVVRCSVPSTVSVMLPTMNFAGTGKNCALSEKLGVESRLKLRHGSPRTCAGRLSREIVFGREAGRLGSGMGSVGGWERGWGGAHRVRDTIGADKGRIISGG